VCEIDRVLGPLFLLLFFKFGHAEVNAARGAVIINKSKKKSAAMGLNRDRLGTSFLLLAPLEQFVRLRCCAPLEGIL